MEILETFPQVFCFLKSRINENGGNTLLTFFATVRKLSQDKILIFESFKLHDFVIT